MKALVLEKYNELVYKDVPDPVIQTNEVLVKVRACGICGSDVHGIDGSTGRRIPPMIMGHEASGTIVKTGTDVIGWNQETELLLIQQFILLMTGLHSKVCII